MKNNLFVIMGIFAVAGFVVTMSCGGDDDKKEKECPVGAEGCPCSDGKCNAGLECNEDDVCEMPAEDTETETEEEDGGDPLPTTSVIDVSAVSPTKRCATGVVVGPEDNDGWNDHWGAGFGLDLCKPDPDYSGEKVPLGECHNDLSRLIGFKLTVTGTLPSELRIQFEDNFEGNDEVAGDNGYIVAEKLDEPDTYLFKDAAVFYLAEDSRPELNPELFTSLQIQIASHLNDIEYFDFCIEDVELVLAEETEDLDGGVGDAGVDTGIEQSTDTNIECDPDSLLITATDNNWVDQCTNAIGLQGHWYSYDD